MIGVGDGAGWADWFEGSCLPELLGLKVCGSNFGTKTIATPIKDANIITRITVFMLISRYC